MALQVWLPLNGTLENKGLSNVTVTNGGATVDNNGKIGKCYYFNGSNYLTFSSPISLSSDCSICCWLDLTNITAVQYFITFSGGGGIRYSGGDNNFLFYIGSSSLNWTYTKVNRFVHVAFVRKSNSVNLYIDGIQIGNAKTSNDAISCTGIGKRDDGYYLNGKMNDLRIYDHALSAKEVKEISKGLILHYKLDGNDIGITIPRNGGLIPDGVELYDYI
jgi:hypothetical protein